MRKKEHMPRKEYLRLWKQEEPAEPKFQFSSAIEALEQKGVIKEMIINIARFVATFTTFAVLTLGLWYGLFRLYLHFFAPVEIFNQTLKQMLGY